jgi:hypothetical protein
MKLSCLLLLGYAACFTAQPMWAQPGTPANSVDGYPGGGVVQAGDVWQSFLPQGFTPCYSDAATATTLGTRTFLRMGNFDRSWTTPATHWPSAYPLTPYWYNNAMVLVFDSDPTFNPDRIGGVANPSYFSGSRNTTNAYSEFAQLTYKSSLQGAEDPARKYSVEPYWVDGIRRQHAVYEAAWPTNLGVDVKLRAHGFQGPNWNNLNDFVIVEIELKNTGVLDMNMDGIAEKITNDIKAVAFQVSGEAYMSVSSYGTGSRNVNDIVPAPIARQACWIDDGDEHGIPWAFAFYRAAPTTLSPTPGNWDNGFNGGSTKNYTDIYTGWVMIDAKVGGFPADASKSTSPLPTKNTIFGTHPTGTGIQRGWFVSGQANRFVHYTDNPRRMFYASTAAFYNDCGRSFAVTSFDLYNLGPNPAGFTGGTSGDPTSFIAKPQANWTRPDGSMQSQGLFDQVSTEDGKADAVTNYPNGYGKFSKGASHTENFDGDSYSGIGPFDLKKDSVMTLVFATVAGYRLEGIQKAVRAARWAYEQNYQIPLLPPMPDMKVSGNLNGSFSIEWDNRAEADAGFAGYKIWRAAQSEAKAFLDEGMRIVDRYQEQMTPGARPSSVFKPVNPKFDAFTKTLNGSTHGKYFPDTWGTWTLMKTILKTDLGAIPPGTSPGYNYLWVDSSAAPGTYWYYVSALSEGTFAGPGGEQTSGLETHNANRNGASGLWAKTFPFAPRNANFPKTKEGLKDIGAAVTRIRVVEYPSLSFGSVNIGASRDLEIRLRNSSDYTMNGTVVSDNPAFSFLSSSFSIPSHDSLVVGVRFTPSHLREDSAKCFVSVPGLPNVDSLSFAGTGTAGAQAPVVTWQNLDESSIGPSVSNNNCVAIDRSGSVYSAVFRYGGSPVGGHWTLRKHDAVGGTQWSCSDTCFGAFPTMAGFVLDGSNNSYLGLNGAAVRPPSAGAQSVAKVSSGGQLLWNHATVLPFDMPMGCFGPALDQTGNAYTTGYASSRSSGGFTRIATTKFTPDGSIEWIAYHEGPPKSGDSTDIGRAIAVDSLGNVYVTGQSGGSFRGDIVTLKYNQSGVMQWVAYYNGSLDSADTGVDIAIGQTGDVYVLGGSGGLGTGSDIVLLKYRATDGALLWSNLYDGPVHGYDGGNSLQIGRNGNILAAGTVYTITGSDGVLLRYTPGGAREVLLQYDGPTGSYDGLSFVREDVDRNIYVAGNCMGALGYTEAVLCKLNPDGVFVWEAHYALGYAGHTSLSSLAVGKPGEVAIGGYAAAIPSGYTFFVVAFGQTTLDVPPAVGGVPSSYSLEQNYPNPFNPSTTIGYSIAGNRHEAIGNGWAKLAVYDMLGREVAVLVNEKKGPGNYTVTWDARGLASGVYFYRLDAAGSGTAHSAFVQVKKMMLLK